MFKNLVLATIISIAVTGCGDRNILTPETVTDIAGCYDSYNEVTLDNGEEFYSVLLNKSCVDDVVSLRLKTSPTYTVKEVFDGLRRNDPKFTTDPIRVTGYTGTIGLVEGIFWLVGDACKKRSRAFDTVICLDDNLENRILISWNHRIVPFESFEKITVLVKFDQKQNNPDFDVFVFDKAQENPNREDPEIDTNAIPVPSVLYISDNKHELVNKRVTVTAWALMTDDGDSLGSVVDCKPNIKPPLLNFRDCSLYAMFSVRSALGLNGPPLPLEHRVKYVFTLDIRKVPSATNPEEDVIVAVFVSATPTG